MLHHFPLWSSERGSCSTAMAVLEPATLTSLKLAGGISLFASETASVLCSQVRHWAELNRLCFLSPVKLTGILQCVHLAGHAAGCAAGCAAGLLGAGIRSPRCLLDFPISWAPKAWSQARVTVIPLIASHPFPILYSSSPEHSTYLVRAHNDLDFLDAFCPL